MKYLKIKKFKKKINDISIEIFTNIEKSMAFDFYCNMLIDFRNNQTKLVEKYNRFYLYFKDIFDSDKDYAYYFENKFYGLVKIDESFKYRNIDIYQKFINLELKFFYSDLFKITNYNIEYYNKKNII